MSVTYTVAASVVDICVDSPKAADVFIVDTNVWFWLTYSRASALKPQYVSYINAAMAASSKILYSLVSLPELAHVIEKTEREIFCKANSNIKTKEYRHNLPLERSRVVSEIKTSWRQVESLGECLASSAGGVNADDPLHLLSTAMVDGYDLFLIDSMLKGGVLSVLTDDGDFSSVPGINLFTANQNVIASATAQGKLTVR